MAINNITQNNWCNFIHIRIYIVMRPDIYWIEIITTTYYFAITNKFSVNSNIFLKCVQRQGTFYDTISMTRWVFGINGTKVAFGNYQIHIGNTTINYSLMNMFILNIANSIINKINNGPIVVNIQNSWVLSIGNYVIYHLIKCVFGFWILWNTDFNLTLFKTVSNYP